MSDRTRGMLFYGWIVIIALAAVNMAGYGLRYSFSTFYPFVLKETGWGAVEVSLAFSLHMWVYGFYTIGIGYLADRWGPRWTIAIFAGIFWPLGFYLSSIAPNPLIFNIAYGVIASLGSAAVYVPVMGTGGKWFIKKRGLALGFLSIGVSFGWMLSSACGALILAFGWRMALVYLAIFALVVLWVAPQFVVRSPEDKGLRPDGERTTRTDGGRSRSRYLFLAAFRDILALTGIFYKPARELFYESLERPRNRQDGGRKLGFFARRKASEITAVDLTYGQSLRTFGFWMIFILYLICLIGLYSGLNNGAAIAMLEKGIPKELVAVSWGLITAFASLVGRFLGGWASDITGRKFMIYISFVLQALGLCLFCWIPQGSVVMYFVASVVFMFTYGMYVPMIPAIVADTCGRPAAAALFGLITLAAGVGTGFGGLIPAMTWQSMGTFTVGFYIGAIAYIVAIIPAIFVRPAVRKRV